MTADAGEGSAPEAGLGSGHSGGGGTVPDRSWRWKWAACKINAGHKIHNRARPGTCAREKTLRKRRRQIAPMYPSRKTESAIRESQKGNRLSSQPTIPPRHRTLGRSGRLHEQVVRPQIEYRKDKARSAGDRCGQRIKRPVSARGQCPSRVPVYPSWLGSRPKSPLGTREDSLHLIRRIRAYPDTLPIGSAANNSLLAGIPAQVIARVQRLRCAAQVEYMDEGQWRRDSGRLDVLYGGRGNGLGVQRALQRTGKRQARESRRSMALV
ncbi:hypothetical protein C8R44DRAFT_168548 [Mycena epipterygia]|nr:hypothetical protein C8R44DRAFT_168548 [Mycena epipterygia]